MSMIGETIAHYEIQEIIGEGGFAVVYRARDVNLDRPVAIKFLQPHRYAEKGQTERFILEAKAASRLDHPNICTIYEIGVAPSGELFIAMAYYKGETLHKKLSGGPLGIDNALKLAIDIARGLASAHNHQVVHRDIKPENIVVTFEGLAKILDFGLAKLIHASAPPEWSVAGTLEYMAPEQIQGQSDRRTDLWALGVVLYEMVTGRRPFTAPKRSDIAHAISHSEFTPVSALRRGAPVELDRLIARALAKNPADRYQRAEEMQAHLHALRHEIESQPTASIEGQPPCLNSIAVLPFANVSHDEDAEYFSDGLADELIHLLSQVRGLRVVAPTSSFEFKGKSESVKRIGERLSVNHVLEGSVRRVGYMLRITAQLTDAQEGYLLWSRRYDRELKDVFAIQEDIALSIVSMLKINPKSDTGIFSPRYAGNLEAYTLYLKGRYYWAQKTESGIRKAGECFQQAMAVDPGCAPAYAGLADFFISLGFWSLMKPIEAWNRGRDLARRSLQLDERLAEAEIAMAMCAIFGDWDWKQAEQRFLRAIELDPLLSSGHFSYGISLLQLGRLESGLLEMLRAREIDPLSLTIGTGVAWAYYYVGDYDRATEECRKVLELQPDYFESLGCMGLIMIAEGRFSDAVACFERALPVSGGSPLGLGFLGYAYGLSGRVADARRTLKELNRIAGERYISPICLTLIHIGLSENDEALTYLEQAVGYKDALLAYAAIFPPFKPLRQAQQFQLLVERIGLGRDSEQLTTCTFPQESASGHGTFS
jgi:serine/threonine protein kinase